MKQALRNLVAILCLLMLGIGSASCMNMASHSQPSCGHCTKHQPPSHQTPSCCETHRQPSAIAAVITFEHPAHISATFLFIFPADALTLGPDAAQRIWPPPLLPHLKLRI